MQRKDCLSNDFSSCLCRNHATIQISPDNSLATLIFHETINDYRSVDVLSLDFIESPWSDIKRDIASFTADVLVNTSTETYSKTFIIIERA